MVGAWLAEPIGHRNKGGFKLKRPGSWYSITRMLKKFCMIGFLTKATYHCDQQVPRMSVLWKLV
jgi:hypothetical protein